MSETYQVIARKWRPTTFAEVIGQNHVTQTLQNAIRLERVPHAFLFTGTRGCGKTSTARILAKALNCSASKGPSPEPCNACENCKAMMAGSHLDVLEIDGASNNGVESVRELRENVRFMPNTGRFKIYIIDEAHMLSQAAWNALLKTLEEPPAHVVFMFATTEPQKVPTTILSRCQRFDFKRVPTRKIAEKLETICKADKISISQSSLLAVAECAQGSMRDGESLLDQLISYAGKKISENDVTEALGLIDRTVIADAMSALCERNGGNAIAVARRVAEAGYDTETFARAILARLRDFAVIKRVAENIDSLVDLSVDELATVKAQADRFSTDEVDQLFAMLSAALDDIRGEMGHLALEMALLRMTHVEPLVPISELMERVEALAGGVPARHAVRTSVATPRANRTATAPVTPKAPTPREAARDTGDFDWPSLVTFIRHRASFLGTYLGETQLVRIDGSAFHIEVPEGTLAEAQLSEPARQDEIAKFISEFTGRPSTVKVTKSAAPPIQSAPKVDRTAERKNLREQALSSPTIQRTMDALGAELADVRPPRKAP